MSSSVVLVAIIVLCAMWLAPHVARRTSVPVLAQVEAPDLQLDSALHTGPQDRPSPSRVVARDRSHVHERETTAMDTTAHAPSSLTVQRGSLAGLRIKWDRTIVFAAGVALLLAAVLTALAAPFTAVTWAVPVVLLLLGAGCVAGLRYLAVTEREQRAATGSSGHRSAPVQHTIFDNEDEVRQDLAEQDREASAALDLPAQDEVPEIEDAPRPAAEPTYTVAELRAIALRVAGSEASGSGAATWQPVPVPKPLYTQAPVVHREAPEPLRVPERPVAKSASLKDAVRTGEQESTALNLDDVLKRRRA
ncbi:hypothetical protein [Kocuria tytonicola]|nr:hypothetical protein [Kocuria tytonicola]